MTTRQLAEKISSRLFTNWFGQRAKFLILEGGDNEDLGFWSEAAVARIIERHLVDAEDEENFERRYHAAKLLDEAEEKEI